MDRSKALGLTTRLLNRRTLLGGAAGLATVTLAGASYTAAQESPPDTPDDGTADATERLDQVRALIALVEADRAAVAGNIDVATADQLLGFANDLLDQAGSATPVDDDAANEQIRLAVSAGAMALAARSALLAELADFGLPSQQATVSRLLAATHEWMTDASGAITASGVAASVTAFDVAQELYAIAYDDYTAGRYAQASRRGQTANQLLRTALILCGELDEHRFLDSLDGAGEEVGRPGFFGRRRRNRRGERPSFEEWMTPVEVPAPAF